MASRAFRGLERLLVSGALIASCLLASSPARFLASVLNVACVFAVYRVGLLRIAARFLALWTGFFLLVGLARVYAGGDPRGIAVDGISSMGLALSVCCAVLIAVEGRPDELLGGFDRLRIRRDISYATLCLIRLLPQVQDVGQRQYALLRLKGLAGGGAVRRLRSYRRLVGPLLTVLLVQQGTKATGMEERGFFAERSRSEEEGALLGVASIAVAMAILVNGVLWSGVIRWRFWPQIWR